MVLALLRFGKTFNNLRYLAALFVIEKHYVGSSGNFESGRITSCPVCNPSGCILNRQWKYANYSTHASGAICEFWIIGVEAKNTASFPIRQIKKWPPYAGFTHLATPDAHAILTSIIFVCIDF